MQTRTKTASLVGLAGWLAATFLTGAVGGAASVNAQSFFADLIQPAWAPPGWLFGPVWTVLYIMMAVAAWRVWRTYGFDGAASALWLFLVHLVFNALWSWVFFAWAMGGLAFAEILILWGLIAWTAWKFWALDKPAGILLVPYLAWVTFAAFLNFTLWRLNPELLG